MKKSELKSLIKEIVKEINLPVKGCLIKEYEDIPKCRGCGALLPKWYTEPLCPQCKRMGENVGEEPTNPSPSPTSMNPLDGQSNNVAASRVNKILHSMSQGMFSDNSWEAISKIFKALQEAGLDVTVESAKYGGHADTESGMPKFKEWQISIPFTNKNGKPVKLIGQITAHGAGSREQPLDRYDITAYVSAVGVR